MEINLAGVSKTEWPRLWFCFTIRSVHKPSLPDNDYRKFGLNHAHDNLYLLTGERALERDQRLKL